MVKGAKGLERQYWVLFVTLSNFLRMFLLSQVYRGRGATEIGLGGLFVGSLCLYFQRFLVLTYFFKVIYIIASIVKDV